MLQQQTKLKHHFPLFDLFLAKTKKNSIQSASICPLPPLIVYNPSWGFPASSKVLALKDHVDASRIKEKISRSVDENCTGRILERLSVNNTTYTNKSYSDAGTAGQIRLA